MIVIPAIDLRGGRVVRLHQGRADEARVYADDAVDVARSWARQGAEWIHVVDLDGAFSGAPRNRTIVGRIVREIDVPIELGGGLRRWDDIERALALGVGRVVLGTAALADDALLARAVAAYCDRIAVGLDARGGRIRTEGWTTDSGSHIEQAIDRLEAIGVARVVYTDIARDGALRGPNIEATSRLAEATSMRVIASGGVSRVQDLARLAEVSARAGGGIEAAIVGKALYERRFTLADAITEARR